MFPKIPVSQDPKGAGEGPWRGWEGAEAGEAGEIGEAGEAGEARKTYVSVSCLIIKNTGEEGGEGEGNRLLLGAQSYARAQKCAIVLEISFLDINSQNWSNVGHMRLRQKSFKI